MSTTMYHDPLPPVRSVVSPLHRVSASGKPVLPPWDEDDLVHSLKQQCTLETELEQAKIMLANKQDFNLTDAFTIFDQGHFGSVAPHELHAGMTALGVHCTYDEVLLFVKRYDRTHDGRLNFNEFSAAFLAFDVYYSSMVSRRGSNYVARVIRPEEVFLPHTVAEF